jgi:putative nucleotidyltransferase with HDIG domain
MIANSQVPLHHLILALSEALDCVHPAVADHQQRVAYVSLAMARRLGVHKAEMAELFHAAALHDIGLIRHENRIKALHLGDLEQVAWHSEVGYVLLKDNPLFATAAEAVRYHHVPWANGQGAEVGGQKVPLASHILVVADAIARNFDYTLPALEQSETITQQVVALGGKHFHPDCLNAFREASKHPAFWLDLASDGISGIILEQIDWPTLAVDEESIEPIAAIFARVVDAASPWTAAHTAGVAATATALARRLNFSPRDLLLLRAAGLFHDLGKLTVPGAILDKCGALSPRDWHVMRTHSYHTFRILNAIGGMGLIRDWAAFHHERLDGAGYPFGHGAEQLTLGARLMAVADVFAALTEDRPYRPGMPRAEALAVLEDQVKAGALDGDIVGVLKRDVDAIDDARRREQADYSRKQSELLAMIGACQKPSPGKRRT